VEIYLNGTTNDYLVYVYAKPKKNFTCCELVFVDHSSFLSAHPNRKIKYEINAKSRKSQFAQCHHITLVATVPFGKNKYRKLMLVCIVRNKLNGLGQHMRKSHPRKHEAVSQRCI